MSQFESHQLPQPGETWTLIPEINTWFPSYISISEVKKNCIKAINLDGPDSDPGKMFISSITIHLSRFLRLYMKQ